MGPLALESRFLVGEAMQAALRLLQVDLAVPEAVWAQLSDLSSISGSSTHSKILVTCSAECHIVLLGAPTLHHRPWLEEH